MAHTICGIDLGTFSVKFAFLEVGFRTHTLRGLMETAVAAGEAPLLERQMEAVREGLAQVSGEVTPYLAVPGDQLSLRVLELPFSDSRKIDQVVGYELEGQIVHSIEDVVFDHLVVGQRPEGATVLAAAARREDLAALIASAEEHGVHPRALFAAPLIYRTLLAGRPRREVRPTPCQARARFRARPHQRLLRARRRTVYARTIRRGGEQLTAAIAKAFNADLDRAEQAKRGDALLAAPAARPPRRWSRSWTACCARRSRRRCASCARRWPASAPASASTSITCWWWAAAAGSAGLLPFLEAELGVPGPLSVGAARAGSGRRAVGRRRGRGGRRARIRSHALAAAIALGGERAARARSTSAGARSSTAPASRCCARRRWHIAALAGAMLLAGGIDVGASYSNLSAERKVLDKELKTATQELFGQPRSDAEAITQLMKRASAKSWRRCPRRRRSTCSIRSRARCRPPTSVKLDIGELDIRPKKTFMKGTVDSPRRSTRWRPS